MSQGDSHLLICLGSSGSQRSVLNPDCPVPPARSRSGFDKLDRNQLRLPGLTGVTLEECVPVRCESYLRHSSLGCCVTHVPRPQTDI